MILPNSEGCKAAKIELSNGNKVYIAKINDQVVVEVAESSSNIKTGGYLNKSINTIIDIWKDRIKNKNTEYTITYYGNSNNS